VTTILECDKFPFLFFSSNSVQLIRFSYKFITDKISELISSIPEGKRKVGQPKTTWRRTVETEKDKL
jgi:hypothetical protein